MINNDMVLKIIKNITSEGKRRVINIPTKHYDILKVGKKVLISEIDYNNISKEELQEIIEKNDKCTI